MGLFSLERRKRRENMITAFKYFGFPHWMGDRKQLLCVCWGQQIK